MRTRERKFSDAEYDAMLLDNIIGTLSLCDDGAPNAVQL